MSQQTAVTMADKQQPKSKAVKIARDLAVKAKMIAETRGETIDVYLSGLLRGPIERDWPKALKKLDPTQENE